MEGVTRITGNSLVDSIADFVGSKKIQDRAIQVSIRKSAVAVELSVNVSYGVSLPAVASAVPEQIESITGLSVSQVNVIIREMEDISEAEEEE